MKYSIVSMICAALVGASCGDNQRVGVEQATESTAGEAVLAVTAPTNAKCIVVTVMGTTTLTKQYAVAAEQSSTFNISALPVGNDTFSASAYNVTCASIGTMMPTYVSDPQTITVGAVPVTLTLQMRPASGGTGTVSVNFPTPSGSIAEFTLLGPTEAEWITAGPDGNLWFTDTAQNSIGQLYTYGYANEYSIPTPNCTPLGITTGPDGNIWFTEYQGNKIGRISTTTGTINEYSLPSTIAGPVLIAAGSDGNVWFTEHDAGKIGRITTGGILVEFALPSSAATPYGIVGGPDGNIWFTETAGAPAGNKIGRMTPSGGLTEFSIPTANAYPFTIAAGADGNLWFTEYAVNKIGKITPSGTVTEYSVPNANSYPYVIAAGNDGTVRFSELGGNRLGSITTSGVITEIPISSPGWGIAMGSDGNLWAMEVYVGKVARITP